MNALSEMTEAKASRDVVRDNVMQRMRWLDWNELSISPTTDPELKALLQADKHATRRFEDAVSAYRAEAANTPVGAFVEPTYEEDVERTLTGLFMKVEVSTIPRWNSIIPSSALSADDN